MLGLFVPIFVNCFIFLKIRKSGEMHSVPFFFLRKRTQQTQNLKDKNNFQRTSKQCSLYFQKLFLRTVFKKQEPNFFVFQNLLLKKFLKTVTEQGQCFTSITILNY